MLFRTVFILLLYGLSVAGCAVAQKRAKIVDIDESGTSAITYPAELRAAYFFNKGGTTHYCAEPVPDVALDTLQKLAAKLSAKLPEGTDLSGAFSTELSNTVVQLAGRTELILLSREMLYRACELTVNYPDQAHRAVDMYMRVADLVENLSIAAKDEAKATKTKAEARKIEATVKLLSLTFGKDKYSECIQAWQDKDEKNEDTLKEWLKDKLNNVAIPLFVYGGKKYAKQREQFVSEKAIQCDNQ